MTEHNWKPGDLAMSSQGSVFAIETERGVRWVYDDGSGGHETARMSYEASVPSGLRPLVVIDPEDREQVEQLATLLVHERATLHDRGVWHDGLAAALREFATPTPPKPDEPQGLGAVVEDSDGMLWVRVNRTRSTPWVAPVTTTRAEAYDDIDVARVLSEGVVA